MTPAAQEMHKALKCLYIATESHVADDVKAKVLARVKELETALDDLSHSADTASLLLKKTCPDEASSLDQHVVRSIEVLKS